MRAIDKAGIYNSIKDFMLFTSGLQTQSKPTNRFQLIHAVSMFDINYT